MFSLAYKDGFVLYLLFTLGALVAVMAYYAWQARTREWRTSEEKLYRCPECNLTFIIGREQRRASCPRCGRRCGNRGG